MFNSLSGIFQRVPLTPYGAFKADFRYITRVLAGEWAKYGNPRSSVLPGLVNTVMTYCVPSRKASKLS